MAESDCSISSVNLTYPERADIRTGSRSYMPLPSNAPLRILRGRPCFSRSVMTTQPPMWLPEEKPLR